MPAIRELAADASFQRLSPEARALVVQQLAPDDVEFSRLSPEAQGLVASQLAGAPQREGEPGLVGSVLERFGLRGPGPLESVLAAFGAAPQGEGVASKALGVVDPALQLLGALPVGVGRAARDITELGGAAVGALTGLGPPTPTPTVLSNVADIAGAFAVPGMGVVPRPVAAPTAMSASAFRGPGLQPAMPTVLQPMKRPFEPSPSMVQSAPLAPPTRPGAPGQGMPILPPEAAPSQLGVASERAGMRGPGLLSAAEQPLITTPPARIERGTSEIVDQFGQRIPTRPPVHIEPADAVLPSTYEGPLGFGKQPTGEALLVAEVAARRAGLEPPPRPSTAPPVPPEHVDLWNTLMRQGGFTAAGVLPHLVGSAVGAASGYALGDTPTEKAWLAAAGAVGGGVAPTLIGRWNARMAKQIEWANRVDAELRTAGPTLERAEALKVRPRLQGPLNPTAVQRAVTAINDTLATRGMAAPPVSAAAQRAIQAGGIPANAPLTSHLVRAIEADPRVVPELSAHLRAHGGTLMDVAQLLVDSSASSAALLSRSRGLSRILEQEMLSNPQAAHLLRSIIDERPKITSWDAASHMAKRGLNAWRGALVAALDTALRNAGVQQIRIGIEAFEQTVKSAVMRAAGVGTTADQDLTAGARFFWEYLVGFASPHARLQTKETLAAFPAFKDKLLQLYSSDVTKALHELGAGLARVRGGELRPMGPVVTNIDRAFEGIELGVKGINLANRFQEVQTRQTVFRAFLIQFLEQRGIRNLDTIPLDQIPIDDLARAVTKALRMTFAESPSAHAPGVMERVFAGVLERTGSSATAATALHVGAGVPFVRFIWNAGKFISERPFTTTTPALRTLFRLLSPTERARITAGDAEMVAKATTGWLTLLGAWQFVNSEYAGDGILEMKTPAGSFKLNALGPIIPAYVWLARLVKEHNQGTLGAQWGEFTREAASLRHRAEDLILGADNVIQNLPAIAAEMRGDQAAAGSTATAVGPSKFAGETVAGAMQFLTSIQRLFAAYGPFIPGLEAAAQEENIRRDLRGKTMGEAFTNPLQARIPVVARQLGIPTAAGLPPQTSALRAGPIPIEVPPVGPLGFPLPSSVVGLKSVVPRTAAEREALVLGMKPREIGGQPTSFPGRDRLVRGLTGRVAEPVMEQITSRPGYEALPQDVRAVVMDRVMERVRGAARDAIRAKINTKLQGGEALTAEEREFIDAMVKAKLDPRERELLRRRGVPVPR